MNGPLSTATIVVSLLLAGWCAVGALRDRPPSRGQLVGTVLVELVVLALAVTALISMARGARPADPVTFVGYLITFVSLPPTGWILARMEPTRWGTVTLGVAILIMPVLVLRLQQVWQVSGA